MILEQAGAADTDMLLALTRNDETNLVACKLAAELFNIPQRIARVRNSAYQEYGETDQDPDTLSASLKAFDITDSIHPEHLLTEHIAGLLSRSQSRRLAGGQKPRANQRSAGRNPRLPNLRHLPQHPPDCAAA